MTQDVRDLIAEARGSFKATNASANLIHRLTTAIEELLGERDAAVAAIERVRAIAERHGVKSWTEEIFAALDGAPEPEWEYGLQDADGYVSFRNLSLKSLRKRAKQTGEVIVRRRPASKWLPVEGENDD